MNNVTTALSMSAVSCTAPSFPLPSSSLCLPIREVLLATGHQQLKPQSLWSDRLDFTRTEGLLCPWPCATGCHICQHSINRTNPCSPRHWEYNPTNAIPPMFWNVCVRATWSMRRMEGSFWRVVYVLLWAPGLLPSHLQPSFQISIHHLPICHCWCSPILLAEWSRF